MYTFCTVQDGGTTNGGQCGVFKPVKKNLELFGTVSTSLYTTAEQNS